MVIYKLIFVLTLVAGDPLEMEINHDFNTKAGCVAAVRSAFAQDIRPAHTEEFWQTQVTSLQFKCIKFRYAGFSD